MKVISMKGLPYDNDPDKNLPTGLLPGMFMYVHIHQRLYYITDIN